MDLIARTGSFVDGMSKASHEAKRAATEIRGSFADMGDVAKSALAPFGEVGQRIGEAFGGIGETFASVTKGLTSMAGGASAASVAIGGAVAAVAALGVAGAGIGVFAAEGANKLFEMSEKTGVSVEALSRLGFAAKESGVSQESLATSLERLNKSAFTAATAPAGATSAYSRLGVSVRDANGQIKPTGELFEDVAEKLAGVSNSTVQAGLASQIFGRSYADILPLLKQGKDGIAELASEADSLGVTLSSKTAADSHKFTQTLDEIQGALAGASNAVLKELLPSMQALGTFIVNDLKDPSSIFRELGTIIGDVVVPCFKFLASAIEVATVAGDYFVTALSQGLQFIFTLVDSLGDAFGDLKSGHFSEAATTLKEAFKQGLSNFTQGITQETEKANKRLQDAFASTYFGVDNGAKETKSKLHPTDVDTAPADKSNLIADRIAKLQAETDAEGKLANAISTSTANTIIATAAAEAQKTIDELSVEAKKKNLTITDQQADSIRKLTLLMASYKEGLNVNKELESFVQKTSQQITAINAEAAAFAHGAAAVEQAQEAAKVAPFAKQVNDIGQVIQALQKLGASSSALTPLLNAYDAAKSKLNAVTQAVHDEAVANSSLEFAKVTEQLTEQISKLGAYTSAVMGGAAAVREFNIAQQVAAFQRSNPLLDASQIAAYRAQLEEVSEQEQKNAAAESVAAQLSFKNLSDKIAQVQLLRSTFKDGSDEQIAADAVLRKDQLDFIKGQEELLLSTQSIGNGFKAFFMEYANDAKTAAQNISDVMNKAFSGIEDNLAKFVTGQKTSWRKMVTDIGQEVAKLGIHTALSSAVGGIGHALGINLGGAAGQKPGVSKSNPMWVRSADGVPGVPGAGDLTNMFGKMWPHAAASTVSGAPDGSTQNPINITTTDTPGTGILAGLGGAAKSVGGAIGGLFSGAGGGIGKLLGPLLSLIPGLADGGDMTPGKAYLTGERGPELIVPRSAKTVIPNHALKTGDSRIVNMGGIHIHGVSDPDAWKKSSAQIQRDFARSTQVAVSRR